MLSSFLLENPLNFGGNEINSFQKLVGNLNKMVVVDLGRQHQGSLDSYFKSSSEHMYLFGVIRYHLIPSILLKRIVYMFSTHITYVFVFPRYYDNYTPFVILMRRRHLDNTIFFVFLKRVILKRVNIKSFSTREVFETDLGIRNSGAMFHSLQCQHLTTCFLNKRRRNLVSEGGRSE